MPGGAVHTVHRDGEWINEIEGQGQEGGAHASRERALEAGRDLARERRVEHMIHHEDGEIQARNSYGHAPRNVLG